MEHNFFDLVSPRFFNPLTGRNKEINLMILRRVNREMEEVFRQVPKDDVVGWIEECLRNIGGTFQDDETDQTETDCRTAARNKLSYFVSCGWIVEENDNRTLKVNCQMDANAITMLKAMEDVIRDESRPIELTGYVRGVRNSLVTFDKGHATETVERIQKDTKELTDALRGLTVRVRRYIQSLMQRDDLSPNEILEQLLREYRETVVQKNFDNLRARDNPAKYTREILDRIERLLEEESMGAMAADYVQRKGKDAESKEDCEEARKFFRDALGYVYTQFDNMQGYLETLYQKNTQYVQTAEARLTFLTNESGDMEGQIIRILRLLRDTDENADLGTPFALHDWGTVEWASVYEPRKRRRKPRSEITQEASPPDEEEIAAARERMEREMRFSRESIDRFVMGQLKGRDSVEAKDMRLKDEDDEVRLFLAAVYGGNPLMGYTVTLTGTSFLRDGREITNYIAKRKRGERA